MMEKKGQYEKNCLLVLCCLSSHFWDGKRRSGWSQVMKRVLAIFFIFITNKAICRRLTYLAAYFSG